MVALDTSIVVRIVTNDDPEAVGRARALLASTTTFVGVTVVLESFWVLTKRYGMTVPAVVAALRLFAGLPGVTFEAYEAMDRAFAWSAAGMGIADAVHLALAQDHDAFATFDLDLVRAGARQGERVFAP